ncbi:Phosphatidylserine synthase [Fasciola hepatica]|uniref:Phosphatidylserine synthase n=1 Tax=Fasciola hepatica TaxID=6192 RepID=A0A4E0R2E8_FASHE|nr:Phosphatidylserine synthase [Fasciola hepatica]
MCAKVSSSCEESNGVSTSNYSNNSCAGTQQRIIRQTAYDWEAEKNRDKDFFDDGTMSFFWNAHTVLCLVIFSSVLLYVAAFENGQFSSEYNMKRGMSATILVFVLFGVLHTPDGPFRRPHPAFWRLILCLSTLYELILVFLLFQDVDDARRWLRHLDPNLGRPLKEMNYGSNCRIYDSSNPHDPWHNVKEKMDGFVLVHFFGWWLKTLIVRDYWLCNVLSFAFEVMEYTLEHQLPNFSECWWDHWLMDFLGCNMAGIWLGMKTLNYLSIKPYHWRGMWKIPGYRGKLHRVLLQFTPHRWTDFDWKPTGSLKRWLGTLVLCALVLLAELNTFYLKYVLWVPPPHFLCLGRLVFILLMGGPAIREYFQFLDDPNCKRLGRQLWMMMCIVITELLIILKFGWPVVTKPLPRHVTWFWLIALIGLALWTFWYFYVTRWLVKVSRRKRQ